MTIENRTSPLGRRASDKFKGIAATTGAGAGGISVALMIYVAQHVGGIESKLEDIQDSQKPSAVVCECSCPNPRTGG